jgi:hypothetical protein
VQSHSVYGIDYTPPPYPASETISGYKKLFGDQKWVWQPVPDSFYDVDFDLDGNAILSEEEEAYVINELERIKDGYYFFNRGELTYITGVHYFYLQYYTLEDGNRPEYRDADRKWFYFLDYCLSKQYITGIIRIKKRREGASSQAACFALWTAITTPQSNCGIVSKTGADAKTLFSDMIVKAFNNLPEFLKPRVEEADSKTSLSFKKKRERKQRTKEKGQIYNKDRGLESRIDWKSTALNSYDSGRVTVIIIDEAGKWSVEVPINQYWPIVQKTLTQGIRRVGFALMVSTVNDAESGGRAYKEVWDGSNHFIDNVTGTGLYRYFSPAYEGLAGFIDEHGFSITENASEDMRKLYLKMYGEEYDGSKDFLLKARAKKKDPTALSEEIRMNPFDEREAFMISQAKCHFSVEKITDQIEAINNAPKALRRGKFYRKEDGTCDFMDLKDGPWLILKFPEINERNRRHMTDKGWAPANTHKYAMGIDPHRHSHTKGTKDLSKTAAWIGERYDSDDPDNTGMPIAFYYDRPKEKKNMYDQMLFAGIFYGVRVHYETDAGDDYYMYYKAEGVTAYIRWTPTCARDPLKPGKSVPGTSSKDPFALSKQLELGIAFIEHHCHKIWFIMVLEEALIYDHSDRQVFDTTVAFLIMLIDMMGDTKATKNVEAIKDKPLIATYNLLNRNN